jgi:acyl carrier protein
MEHNEDTSSPDIFSKLRIIIAKQLEITDELTIKPESTFTEDLLVDSLDLIELVIKIEDGFGIEIDDTTAGDIKTVQDVIDYIETETGA